jgi:ABC-2 type transport system permease protein
VSAFPASIRAGRGHSIRGEMGKLPAFLRRDFLQAWSYRMTFVSDALGLALQAVIFYYVGKMIDPDVLPSFGGTRASYMEFVTIGIAITMFISLGLGRVATAIRSEQLMGTLETVLLTPTAPATIQIGSVVYDLIYIPLRTGIFLFVIAITVGLDFELDGILPALVILLAFIPFVWGLGIASAAATLAFKRGGGVGTVVTLMTIASGAYFPLTLFPAWVETLAVANPMTAAIDGMRQSLLGGAGWSEVAPALAVLVPGAAVTLAIGLLAFRAALRRERRTGSIGLY